MSERDDAPRLDGSDLDERDEEGTELKRAIGPALLLLFILGDVLGTGVYALTGKVAKDVGGMVWLPFLIAFAVAMITALSYLELVTKYPRAGGAAVYAHKAFGVHFLTFVLAFMVMASGLTSSSSGAKAFAANVAEVAGWNAKDETLLMALAAVFMLIVMAVNLIGVSESVKANVVLTLIELSGLLIVIVIGLFAIGGGKGDLSRLTDLRTGDDGAFFAVTAATALAFFAMVGFEDSVNMAEETKHPSRTFPKMMILGLTIAGVIYALVAITSVALVTPDELGKGSTPLLKVVEAGASWFPLRLFAIITMFAVANTALLNMLMASRLVYGMANEGVLPRGLGRIWRSRRTPWVAIVLTTLLALGLIWFADLKALGGTTSLLLLCVFTVVNVAVLVLRKDSVNHHHFRVPTIVPVIGAVVTAFLASPLSKRATEDYRVAGVLLAIGVGLWLVQTLVRAVLPKKA